jgi:uncharacterized protein YxjI
LDPTFLGVGDFQEGERLKPGFGPVQKGRDQIAEVSKKWFRVRDSYGVQIDPGQNDVLILAVTVAVDMMAHEGR